MLVRHTMRVIRYTEDNYESELAALDRRATPPAGVEEIVKDIISDVRHRGDAAILDLARKFDHVDFSDASALRVTDEELNAASESVDDETRKAIAASRENVTDFAKKSLRQDWTGTNAQGAIVGERYQPFERVGIYVPGGSAPLVSTANMTVCLARAAGCPEIVVTTPPGPDGSVNPALLYALQEAGATEIYKIGGAQAVAAMALGTDTVAPVLKVYGPGNSFVVEAKRQLFGVVAVDLLPGPSEVVVLSDESGSAAFIAADLLAQAEHGGDSGMGFITDSEVLFESVQSEIESQVQSLSRQEQLSKSLESGAWLILVEDINSGIDIVNAYAPEHLSLISRSEDDLLPRVKTAGAIFLGNHSPVAVGDFLAGPSHELPTGGAGKAFPGLTADQFQRRTSVVRLDEDSIRQSAPYVETFARIEGLDAHGRSATIRVDS